VRIAEQNTRRGKKIISRKRIHCHVNPFARTLVDRDPPRTSHAETYTARAYNTTYVHERRATSFLLLFFFSFPFPILVCLPASSCPSSSLIPRPTFPLPQFPVEYEYDIYMYTRTISTRHTPLTPPPPHPQPPPNDDRAIISEINYFRLVRVVDKLTT